MQKADYEKSPEAKAILKSYQRSDLRGLRQADGKATYYQLKNEYANTPDKLSALHGWLSEQVEAAAKRNQLFIPYYILLQLQLLKVTTVPEFVAQLEEWFPSRFDASTRKQVIGALYDESEQWKSTTSGAYPQPAALVPYIQSTKMRPTKSNLFVSRMKEGFNELRDLSCDW